jgi:twinkle protein|tara:strand:+ start:1787 stop:3502 length:1716 start_codon:yes stop_codon:yes gene_type:complete
MKINEIDPRIKLKNYNIGTQKVHCPECQPPHKLSDYPLSVTIEADGIVFLCHHCGYTGGTKNGSSNFVTRKEKVYQLPSVKETDMLRPDTLFSYFAERGISKETVQKKKIYVSDKTWIAFPYHDQDGSMVNIKYRTRSKKFKQEPNAKRTLYNYDLAHDADTIIFVEGEMDVLTLIECGFDNVVSLPDGAPQEAKFNEKDARFAALANCPLNATKVIIFTDNDTAGQSLHAELVHRFGKDKCWFVDYPSGCKDANEIFLQHGGGRIQTIIDNANPYPVDGVYSANQFYGSVLDLYNGNYTKPVEIGYPELDEIYKVLKGTFHVVTGIPNHGKSSFLDQVLTKMAEDHKWRFCIFSPEHSTSMHLRRLVQIRTRKAFDEGLSNRMSKDELQDALAWVNEHFYFIETKDSVPDIDYILDKAKSAVLKYGCDGLIIDPYNEVSAVRKGNQREDEHVRDFISKCKRFSRVHDVVTWVVAHPTKLPKENNGQYSAPTAYDISGASHWSNQSDVILAVHRDFDNKSIEVITRKVREQGLYGQIGKCTFLYNYKTRHFEPDTRSDDIREIPHWGHTYD